ncbi:MAG: nuclear transport factor 2 family protein [Alphaproteobacteria bacterium]|jgi:hypothetical protein|nr:nuclear transport factor 2 family protein [Alphaproteobacteria bacterium]MDP6563887.1 nuclear transport factor 2 family protein [Alphaproteobacteria bacterium]MDP6815921.1 nuclear transport factor 2 family protein [Alphaproteobacteria bacterium]
MDAKTRDFLDRWYAAVAAEDLDALADTLADDAEISSPAYWGPKGPKSHVMTVLTGVLGAFEDFRYDKEWVDGRELILEFSTRVGDKSLRGIDRISLNEDGQLRHIEVMVRPINGLMALAEAVRKHVMAAS